MAIGQSGRSRDQLAKDRATGQPITYRRVPSKTGYSRRYYNPKTKTGETVSEHYVLRVYRPSLEALQRQRIGEQTEKNIRFQRIQVSRLADTYIAKQAADGNILNVNQALRSADFNALYRNLRYVAYQARHAPIGSQEREQYYDAEGEYAQLLVLLGRRLGTETFAVGESPKAVNEAGSYINLVVLPALQARANQ